MVDCYVAAVLRRLCSGCFCRRMGKGRRMKTNAVVVTAADINEAHQLARSSAATAVEWAVTCGRLLKIKKDDLGHGNWESWVEKHCEFTSRSASAYMKVAAKQAQIGSALPI